MANEIKLELYTFRIREKHSDSYLKLDNFFEENDFFSFFEGYVKAFDKDLFVNELQKKSLQFISEKTSIASTKRMISGILESGDYGVEGKIVNRKSKEKKYTKEADDLDIKPFYFLISAPKSHDKGMLVLQRLGGFGINGIFTNHFSAYFKDKYDGLTIEFSPFVSAKLAKTFIENGGIRQLSLRRYDVPTDIIDKLGLNGHKEDVLSIELKITAKKNSVLPFNKRVEKFIKNPNGRLFDLKEFDKLGFDGTHDSSIKVKHGNNTRTIDLSETAQLRPYYDIHSEVKKESSGHPVFNSIDAISKKLIDDLMKEFYA